MPKMRNGDTPVAMLTNWLGRKCRNHNPLSELKLSKREMAEKPRLYENEAAQEKEVLVVSDTSRNRLIYHNGTQAFEIVVNEIPMDEVEDLETEVVAA